MKNTFLVGVMLLAVAAFQAQAQTTKPGMAGNKTNYGSKSGRPAIGSGDMGSNTVDGSNGSATNDGASGQNGSPAPLPSATANQRAASDNRKSKMSTSRPAKASGSDHTKSHQ